MRTSSSFVEGVGWYEALPVGTGLWASRDGFGPWRSWAKGDHDTAPGRVPAVFKVGCVSKSKRSREEEREKPFYSRCALTEGRRHRHLLPLRNRAM